VTLKVYDILGNEVSTLVNSIVQPGSRTLQFEGGDLPDGIYYYQLETEHYTAIKKFILRR